MARSDKKKMSQKAFTITWTAVIACFLVLCLVATIGMNSFSVVMDFVFGGGKITVKAVSGSENWDSDYYTADYTSKDAVEEAARALTEEIESEGIVLMKNENQALPLNQSNSKEQTISVFGWSFNYPVYGGSGSGDVDTATCVSPAQGLTNAGFALNESLAAAYQKWSESTSRVSSSGGDANCSERPKISFSFSDWSLVEMPVSNDLAKAAAQVSDVALLFVSRVGGEQMDLPLTMGSNTLASSECMGFNENKHYLQLSDEEEAVLEAIKEARFQKVIVVLNSSNAMQVDALEHDNGVDAILWIGGPGQTGFNALGKILSGEVTPSGRTADIYPADFTKDPTYANFSDPYFYSTDATLRNEYSNVSLSNTGYTNAYFTQYEEGVYLGYRYYETAADIGILDYTSSVTYPFGYGLSYTTFSQKLTAHSVENGIVTAEVQVTNTGSVAGKDVVQLYYRAPYGNETTNPIKMEKSTAVLAGFAKTSLLEPGASETITITFSVEDMASYDDTVNCCYVLDDGDYIISLRSNSHDVIDQFTWHNDSTVIYNDEHDGARSTDAVAATNAFGDYLVEGEMNKLEKLTRSDNFASMPQAPTEADRIASDDLIASIQAYRAADHNDAADKMPKTGESNGISLIDMRGLDYNDPKWEELLNQVTTAEMKELITLGGYGTRGVTSVSKPITLDNDGPQALKYQNWAGVDGSAGETLNAFPSEAVVACTWNVELSERWGEIVGNEGLLWGITGWYGPGLNIHRSPFGGRNFEYFSEDPLLTGKMAAAVVQGAAGKGLIAYMKHFALNDQETYRSGKGYETFNGVYTWATEQTMREIYLRAFEIAVKEPVVDIKYITDKNGTRATKEMPACIALMSSFNAIGYNWAGGCDALLTTVLRDEWNFTGTVITDFCNPLRAYMNKDMMLRAGGDLVLNTTDSEFEDMSSATAISTMRRATHNILYTFAHSNAMQNLTPGSTIQYTMAPWQIGLIVAWVLWALVAALGVVLIVRRRKAVLANPERYKVSKAKKSKTTEKE